MSRLPPTQRTAFELIRDLSRSLRLFQEDAVICENITFTQFVILDYGRQRQPLRLGDLHRLLGVEKSTTSRLIKPLIDKGLLEKRRNAEDRRSYELHLTARGGSVHTTVWNCFVEAGGRFFKALPDQSKKETIEAMQNISQAFLRCCDREECCK